MYEYSLADYMFQNTQREADLKALKLLEAGKDVEAIMLSSFANGLRQIENDEVLNTVKAYYSALNRRNFDDLRLFWLPDSNAELAIPGIKRTVSITG